MPGMRTDGRPSNQPRLKSDAPGVPAGYRKLRPSDRNRGLPNGIDWDDWAKSFSGSAEPPLATTRRMLLVDCVGEPEKRMVPSLFQLPPRAALQMQIVCGGPPLASTRFSCVCAMYAMDRLSGDQNGCCALSVPFNLRASNESSDCTHRCCPSGEAAMNARARPSGEMANGESGGLASNDTPDGGTMWNRTAAGSDGFPLSMSHSKNPSARLPKAPRRAPAVSDNSRLAVTGAGDAGVRAIHCNSRITSDAACQRSSGDFARQRETRWSSAGDTSGCDDDTAAGVRSRIAASRVAWDFPSNARRPVSISCRSAPNAKMSVRASASKPSICSGAMYWNVPRIAPCAVRFGGVVGSMERTVVVTAG